MPFVKMFQIRCNSELFAILNQNIKQDYFIQNILLKYCQLLLFNILKLIFDFGIHDNKNNPLQKVTKMTCPVTLTTPKKKLYCTTIYSIQLTTTIHH